MIVTPCSLQLTLRANPLPSSLPHLIPPGASSGSDGHSPLLDSVSYILLTQSRHLGDLREDLNRLKIEDICQQGRGEPAAGLLV